MLAEFDKDHDGDFSAEELAAPGKVRYSEYDDSREGLAASGAVSSFAGLELFTGITEFYFNSPVYVTEGPKQNVPSPRSISHATRSWSPFR